MGLLASIQNGVAQTAAKADSLFQIIKTGGVASRAADDLRKVAANTSANLKAVAADPNAPLATPAPAAGTLPMIPQEVLNMKWWILGGLAVLAVIVLPLKGKR